MVILGLGSNVGDRLANLRRALQAIKNTPGIDVQQVSPVYLSDALLPENAPPEWDMPHLNLAIRCETDLAPLELLSQLKNIEYSIGRKPEVRHWGPRILDIDILAWDQHVIQTEKLTVPHANLQDRPFALWPLADVAPLWRFPLAGPNFGKTAIEIAEKWGSPFSGEAPLHTRQIYQRVDTPRLVGIINVTPDSFSDGGNFLDSELALQQALFLIASGAEVIDIGAESTAPKSHALSAEEEWKRLHPILETILSALPRFLIPPKISIDTRHAQVAEKALLRGIDWINDVTGLEDPAMRELIAASGKECVVMHHLTIPPSRQHVVPRGEDIVKTIYSWGEARIKELEQSGIKREKIIFDPGIGFGKLPEQSLLLVKHAAVFKNLGTRLLIGHSRKTFLSQFTPQTFANRDIETLGISLYLANLDVDYLRLHQVEMCSRAFRVMRALEG